MGEIAPALLAPEDALQAPVDVGTRLIREGVVFRGVDQVAQRMAEKPGAEVQIAEGAAPRVPAGAGHEVGGEGRGAFDGVLEAGGAYEQEGTHERFAQALDQAGGARGHLAGGQAILPVDVKAGADAVSHQRDEVLHGDLVFGHQQGHDVAVGARVGSDVDALGQVGEVAAGRDRVARATDGDVPHVELVAVRAGDVPAAPALPDGRRVGGHLPQFVGSELAVLVGRSGAHDVPGHPAPGERIGVVALEAEAGLAADARAILPVRLQVIEDRSQLRVLGGDLEAVRPRGPGDIDAVVEVEGARGLGPDQAGQQAGLGEHQHLGGDGNVEFAQDGRQVGARALAGEGDFPALQTAGEDGHRVAGLAGGVGDGGVFGVVGELGGGEGRGGGRGEGRGGGRGAVRRGQGGDQYRSCRQEADGRNRRRAPCARPPHRINDLTLGKRLRRCVPRSRPAPHRVIAP